MTLPQPVERLVAAAIEERGRHLAPNRTPQVRLLIMAPCMAEQERS